MKIFLDTADSAAISTWVSTGLIDGVTTNPSLLASQGGDPKKKVIEICSLVSHGDVSIEVTETEPDKVYKQAKVIAAIAKNVVVKIPCHQQYYEVIKKLSSEKIALNITLVFTVLQGLMMAKLGVKYVSPFVGRLDDIDVEGVEVLHEMKQMMLLHGFKTQVLAASLRTVRHFHQAVMAGADVATLPIAVLEKSLSHPLTDQGMDLFSADWAKLGVRHFP